MADLIDRQALVGKMQSLAKKYADMDCFAEAYDYSFVQNVLLTAPAIEAEPVRHGRWEPLEYDGYADGCPVWDLWECSECQEEHSGDEDTLTPYCPNCGAKMDLPASPAEIGKESAK